MKDERTQLDLEAEALAALEKARGMPRGPERSEAMKTAGILRNAADLRGVCFAKRDGRRKHSLAQRGASVPWLNGLFFSLVSPLVLRRGFLMLAIRALPAQASSKPHT